MGEIVWTGRHVDIVQLRYVWDVHVSGSMNVVVLVFYACGVIFIQLCMRGRWRRVCRHGSHEGGAVYQDAVPWSQMQTCFWGLWILKNVACLQTASLLLLLSNGYE